MDKKRSSLQRLLAVAVAFCLLLSLLVVYLTDMLVGGEAWLSREGYDGTVISSGSIVNRFNRTVLQNASRLGRLRSFEYKILGTVDHDNVIAGKNGFLFRVAEPKYDYNYPVDYIGGSQFGEREKRAFLSELQRRQREYAEQGAAYLFVVIPNAGTVYDESMPEYLRAQKGTTRLEDLDAFLADSSFKGYVNMAHYFQYVKDGLPLYNNTENSLTALGAYYVYRAVFDSISTPMLDSDRVIERDALQFYTYLTEGGDIAKEAGLQDVAKNRTVSLSNDMLRNYKTLYTSGYIAKTQRVTADGSLPPRQSVSMLLQFSTTGDRLQAEPYFSCTFDYVTYQPNHYYNEYFYNIAAPNIVVQLMYEYELSHFMTGFVG